MNDKVKINIDSGAGFCFGVKNAIEIAEKEADNDGSLLCLGQIVHNELEVERLENKGIRFIDQQEFEKTNNQKLLFRAHGEPPENYHTADNNKLKVVDATCPIVLKLQERIIKSWHNVKDLDGQLVIFGQHGHPEVKGLSGNIDHQAIVIENIREIDKLQLDKPIVLYSQTTKSKEQYQKIIEAIIVGMKKRNFSTENFKYYKSVCGQVANRTEDLQNFAKSNDLIIFMSGENSSNGKYLYGVCREVNKRSYKISHPNQIKNEWFENVKSIGISGATSTPMWQLELIENSLNNMFNR